MSDNYVSVIQSPAYTDRVLIDTGSNCVSIDKRDVSELIDQLQQYNG